MTLSRVITSVSDIETVVEVRDFDSPFVGFDIPRGQVIKVSMPVDTFNRRN
jgi:hypothetical protein